uniref:Amino acid transporter n=1 Tax=Schmidtea mediterranea TaxID=79327 RepID=A0A0H3YJW6_SCHMD|nr:slc1a-3 [Schmidtea mediterranea]
MVILRNFRRSRVGKFLQKKDNILVICTIIAAVLAVVISIPMKSLDLSAKTIYCISIPGIILMNLLKMMILPLLVLSLLTGLTSLNISTSGKLGMYTMVYYVLTTFFAVCLGMALVVMIHPGNKDFGLTAEDENRKPIDAVESILDLFNNLFPDNIIRSTFQQAEIRFINKSVKSRIGLTKYVQQPIVSYANFPNFLGLIFFSIFFGIVLNAMGSKGELLVSLINILNDLTMRMVKIILYNIPIGIFFLVLTNLLKVSNLKLILSTMGMFAVTVLTGIAIHMFIILPIIYAVFTRKNPYLFMLGMSRAMIVAFVTQSSSATLPVTMTCAEENNKIDPRITKFMFPIGAIINMDGTGLYEAVAAIFIAQINDIQLSTMQMIRISVTSTLAAIGAATVPSAGLVTLLIVLSTAGLPTHQVSLLYTFDWFLDRCRTSINILGDAFGGGIIQSLCRNDLNKIVSNDHKMTNL